MAASRVDGCCGLKAQGVRWWFTYRVHGMGLSPFMSRRATEEQLDEEEEDFEDFGVWLIATRPSGRQISYETAGKYISEVRAYLFRMVKRRIGRGAAGSIIPDILRGYARLVDQPPKLERDGCTPDGLARGMAILRCSRMWRAALTFGMVVLARGCEFALTSGERFEQSEHLVPADVVVFAREGARHARVRMRKRKDMRVLRGKQAEVFLAGGATGYFDAVAELEAWLEERRAQGISDARPLFCHADGSAITVTQVRDMVKAVMRAAGCDPRRYGAHSPRIGGATAALAAGVSPQLIRLMGRWSSDIYQIYCRMSVESALGVGSAIASAMVTPAAMAAGFHEEHFELRDEERRTFILPESAGFGEGGSVLDSVDEDAM